MTQQRHMKLDTFDGYVILIVEDTELSDFVEDVLCEQFDIEYAFVGSEEINGVATYTMYYPDITDPTEIRAALETIDPDEIQRIWELNN